MKNLKQIKKGNEDQRRSNIINISRKKDSRYIPQLIELYNSNETYENKRHIIRALGNIGDSSINSFLIKLLNNENGIILGDIAESLGKLKEIKATEILEKLTDNNIKWVAEKSQWALKQLLI